MPKLNKDVLYAGTWKLADGRLFKCSPDEIPHFAKRMSEMLGVGLNIPLTWEHQENIYAMSQEEMQKKLADTTKATLGWAESAEAKAGALNMEVNVPAEDDASKLQTIRFVSPTIKNNYVDSKGRMWPGKSIIQLAVTPIPVQHEQKPFRGVVDAPMHLSLAGWTKDEQVDLAMPPPGPGPHVGEGLRTHGGLAKSKATLALTHALQAGGRPDHHAVKASQWAHDASHAASDELGHTKAANAHAEAASIHGGYAMHSEGEAKEHHLQAREHHQQAFWHHFEEKRGRPVNLSAGDDKIELAHAKLHMEGRTQMAGAGGGGAATAVPLEHHEIAKHFASLAMAHAKPAGGPAMHASFLAEHASKKAKTPAEHYQAAKLHNAASVSHNSAHHALEKASFSHPLGASNKSAADMHEKAAAHHVHAAKMAEQEEAKKQQAAGGKQSLRMAPTPKVGQAVKLSTSMYFAHDPVGGLTSHELAKKHAKMATGHANELGNAAHHTTLKRYSKDAEDATHAAGTLQDHLHAAGAHAYAAEMHHGIMGESPATEHHLIASRAHLTHAHRYAVKHNLSLGDDFYELAAKVKKKKSKGRSKMGKVLREFASGKLKTSAGKKVTDKKQAVAIAYSEARRAGAKLSMFSGDPSQHVHGTSANALHAAKQNWNYAPGTHPESINRAVAASTRAHAATKKTKHGPGDDAHYSAHEGAALLHLEAAGVHERHGNEEAARHHYRAAGAHAEVRNHHELSLGANMATKEEQDQWVKECFPELVKEANDMFGGNVLGDDVTPENFAERYIVASKTYKVCDEDDEGYVPPNTGGNMEPKEVQTGLLTLSEKEKAEMLSLKATAEAERKRGDAFEHRILTGDRNAAKERVSKLVPKVLTKPEADALCADIDKEMTKLSLDEGFKHPCIIRLEAFEQVAARMPNDRFNLSLNGGQANEIKMPPKDPAEARAEAEKNGKAQGVELAGLVGYNKK